MDLWSLLWWTLVVLMVVQVVRLVLADGDLSLMFAEKFGKKKESLRGKVVWIVGASGGIGEHLAYELSGAGCRLILSARREEELQRVAKQCLRHRAQSTMSVGDIKVLPMDVLKCDQHQEMLEAVLKDFNRVDILINNAGRSQRGFVVDTPFEIERQVMELNYFSVVSLTKVVLAHMMKRRQGHIVTTSSFMGKLGNPFTVSYCAAKHAVQGWFDGLRAELASENIPVTLLCPGPVFSGVQRAAFSTVVGEEYGKDQDVNERRMSTARCAELCTVAIANQLGEVWICKHPALLTTYLAQYAPNIQKWALKTFGPNAMYFGTRR